MIVLCNPHNPHLEGDDVPRSFDDHCLRVCTWNTHINSICYSCHLAIELVDARSAIIQAVLVTMQSSIKIWKSKRMKGSWRSVGKLISHNKQSPRLQRAAHPSVFVHSFNCRLTLLSDDEVEEYPGWTRNSNDSNSSTHNSSNSCNQFTFLFRFAASSFASIICPNASNK